MVGFIKTALLTFQSCFQNFRQKLFSHQKLSLASQAIIISCGGIVASLRAKGLEFKTI